MTTKAKRVGDLRQKDLQTGFCPICLNICHWVEMREGGRQFGFTWAGERAESGFGEVIWDTSGKVYWHMGAEDGDLTDREAYDHFADDMNSLLKRHAKIAAKRSTKTQQQPMTFDQAAAWFPGRAA